MLREDFLFLALKRTQPGIVDFLSTSAEEPTISGSVDTSVSVPKLISSFVSGNDDLYADKLCVWS